MSAVSIRVGEFQFEFDSPPRGRSGVVHVRHSAAAPGAAAVASPVTEARYWIDAHGLVIQLDHQVLGFDLETSVGDDGRTLYRVTERLHHHEWEGVSARRAGEDAAASAGGAAKRVIKVKAQMPGKIVRVAVKEGDTVKRDQSLLVMEAMKMENEIRASQDGRVTKLRAVAGQAVETGAELLVIEP